LRREGGNCGGNWLVSPLTPTPSMNPPTAKWSGDCHSHPSPSVPLHEPERCRLPDGRAHQPACRRGVRRQPRRLSGDAALGKALDVWGVLEMRKWIPARKRCQPHSPPATALHDAIAFNGAFRRFMVPMRVQCGRFPGVAPRLDLTSLRHAGGRLRRGGR